MFDCNKINYSNKNFLDINTFKAKKFQVIKCNYGILNLLTLT